MMPRRIEELDALRGFMLVWITLTHLPTVVSHYVNQPFGYVAATEGFIFLSALFTGRIYFNIADREGNPAMRRKLWMRAGRLYCYQLLLLGIAFLIGAPIAAHGNRPAMHNLLNFYFSSNRIHAFVDAALMIYRPPLLDILPIYIMFLALTPFALILGSRLGWKYVFAGGFTVWLLAQFGFRGFVYNFMVHAFGLRIPLNEMGAFDLWAWQLWWMVGLWLGVRWAKGDLHLDIWTKRMLVPAAIVAAFFLVLRQAQNAGLVELGRMAFLVNKWRFGLGRIVDFAALATLAIYFRAALRRLAIQPLAMLGKASLEVFCVHLLCVFTALLILGNRPVIGGWQAMVIVLTSLSALVVTARIVTHRRAKAVTDRLARPSIQPPLQPGYGEEVATDKAA
ncbi:MAG: OpgC domain-containing protein [Candidatus Korobacteraceae bacterium]|jgi:hypothetical protein